MLIERLRLKNILSFRETTVKLEKLNVLIGPNGVGKSNLIEVIGLLQALPTSLVPTVNWAGGIRQWLWMGEDLPMTATVECGLRLGRAAGRLSYRLQVLGEVNGGYAIQDESLTGYFSRSSTEASVFSHGSEEPATQMFVNRTESLLSQFKNPADPTPITAVGRALTEIQIFREFRTGPGALLRQAISTTAPKDGLLDGANNLAMVLQDLHFRDQRAAEIDSYLKRFCERFSGAKVEIADGLARIYLSEDGLKGRIPSSRMSGWNPQVFALLVCSLSSGKVPPFNLH